MNRLVIAMMAAAALACGKKDDSADRAPAPAPPLEPGPTAKGNPSVIPAPAGGAAVACEKLLTIDAVVAACGVAAGDVTIEEAGPNTGKGALACGRTIRFKGEPGSSLVVSTAPASAAAAAEMLAQTRKADGIVKDVAVGDAGVLIVRKFPVEQLTPHDIEAIKGPIWMKLGTNISTGETVWCSDDRLVRLAAAIASHLP